MIRSDGIVVGNQEGIFKENAYLKSHLGYELLKSLKRWKTSELMVDYATERHSLSSLRFLAISSALSEKLTKELKDQLRVGIVLPPGLGGALINVALILAGKVPVNLNFTTSGQDFSAYLKKAELKTVITASPIIEKYPHLKWPQNLWLLDSEIKKISKISILLKMIQAKIMPVTWLTRLWKISKEGGLQEAVLLFTSGSGGMPKAVVLTHANILGNVLQIERQGILPQKEILLQSLPIFHSFGLTVGIWFSLLKRVKTVCVPSPLDCKKIAHVAELEKATVLVSTPTFLKPYFKRVNKSQLGSLKYVIVGAEKTPEGMHQAWKQHFGSEYLEGYGLTETTPVVAVNLPFWDKTLFLMRKESVGQIFPGMAVKTVDPDTEENLPRGQIGLLAFQGCNVFSGYLEDPALNKRVFKNGWFLTGDLGYADEDGFIYVKGRLSRFSKIGGEMVSHTGVEAKILEALGTETEDLVIAVVGRSDSSKGEALVLLSTVDINFKQLREKLLGIDIPHLWIPRYYKRVEQIPVLASGKLDIKGCQELANLAI